MRTAIVSGNIVTNIAAGQVAGGVALQSGEWCAIGAAYDPAGTPRFTPRPVQKIWTSYEFLNRFTAEERATIREAAVLDGGVADFLMLAQAAQDIVSDDPVTIGGMDYLVSLTIITPARRAEILS